MVHGSSVVVEDQIRQAVDISGPGQEELADVRLGIRSGVVEVVVPNVPLGARYSLEMVRPEADEVLRLIPLPRVTEVAEIFVLEGHPGVVKETVEKRGLSQSCLRRDQVAVWLGHALQVETDVRVEWGKDGSQDLGEPRISLVLLTACLDGFKCCRVDAASFGMRAG